VVPAGALTLGEHALQFAGPAFGRGLLDRLFVHARFAAEYLQALGAAGAVVLAPPGTFSPEGGALGTLRTLLMNSLEERLGKGRLLSIFIFKARRGHVG
jgi:hypothetical protein